MGSKKGRNKFNDPNLVWCRSNSINARVFSRRWQNVEDCLFMLDTASKGVSSAAHSLMFYARMATLFYSSGQQEHLIAVLTVAKFIGFEIDSCLFKQGSPRYRIIKPPKAPSNVLPSHVPFVYNKHTDESFIFGNVGLDTLSEFIDTSSFHKHIDVPMLLRKVIKDKHQSDKFFTLFACAISKLFKQPESSSFVSFRSQLSIGKEDGPTKLVEIILCLRSNIGHTFGGFEFWLGFDTEFNSSQIDNGIQKFDNMESLIEFPTIPQNPRLYAFDHITQLNVDDSLLDGIFSEVQNVFDQFPIGYMRDEQSEVLASEQIEPPLKRHQLLEDSTRSPGPTPTSNNNNNQNTKVNNFHSPSGSVKSVVKEASFFIGNRRQISATEWIKSNAINFSNIQLNQRTIKKLKRKALKKGQSNEALDIAFIEALWEGNPGSSLDDIKDLFQIQQARLAGNDSRSKAAFCEMQLVGGKMEYEVDLKQVDTRTRSKYTPNQSYLDYFSSADPSSSALQNNDSSNNFSNESMLSGEIPPFNEFDKSFWIESQLGTSTSSTIVPPIVEQFPNNPISQFPTNQLPFPKFQTNQQPHLQQGIDLGIQPSFEFTPTVTIDLPEVPSLGQSNDGHILQHELPQYHQQPQFLPQHVPTTLPSPSLKKGKGKNTITTTKTDKKRKRVHLLPPGPS